MRPIIQWHLKQIMDSRGMDYKNLAAATGLHPATVSNLRNKPEAPERIHTDTMIALCGALGCQPGDLMTYSIEPLARLSRPRRDNRAKHQTESVGRIS